MASWMAAEGSVRLRSTLASLEVSVRPALTRPLQQVISGYRANVSGAQDALEKEGVRVQRLTVSHGFHSPQMREMEAAFEQVAASIQCNSPRLRLISSVTGREIGNELCDPAYWRHQVAQPVRFRELVQTLEQSSYRTFLEVGQGTTLAALGQQCLADADTTWLPSLQNPGRTGVRYWIASRVFTRSASLSTGRPSTGLMRVPHASAHLSV